MSVMCWTVVADNVTPGIAVVDGSVAAGAWGANVVVVDGGVAVGAGPRGASVVLAPPLLATGTIATAVLVTVLSMVVCVAVAVAVVVARVAFSLPLLTTSTSRSGPNKSPSFAAVGTVLARGVITLVELAPPQGISRATTAAAAATYISGTREIAPRTAMHICMGMVRGAGEVKGSPLSLASQRPRWTRISYVLARVWYTCGCSGLAVVSMVTDQWYCNGR